MLKSATVIRKSLLLSATLGLVLPFACDPEEEDTGGNDTDGDGIPAEFAGKENPVEGDSAAIAAGMSTYMGMCATCHGDAGAGDGPGAMTMPPATDFTSHSAPDDVMLWVITDGIEGTAMGSYGGMSEMQIWEVVSYIRTLQ